MGRKASKQACYHSSYTIYGEENLCMIDQLVEGQVKNTSKLKFSEFALNFLDLKNPFIRNRQKLYHFYIVNQHQEIFTVRMFREVASSCIKNSRHLYFDSYLQPSYNHAFCFFKYHIEGLESVAWSWEGCYLFMYLLMYLFKSLRLAIALK